MKLSDFIVENIEEITAEWEEFAKSLLPSGEVMTSLALRDHATQILRAIAVDIASNQTQLEQAYKSKGFVPIAPGIQTAAMTHGALRHLAGFDLRQLAAEFRALRASVLRLWLKRGGDGESAFYEMTRFNESIDQALAESIANYSDSVSHSRDTFLAILGHDLRSPLSTISNSGLYLASPGLLFALRIRSAFSILKPLGTWRGRSTRRAFTRYSRTSSKMRRSTEQIASRSRLRRMANRTGSPCRSRIADGQFRSISCR
jgi:signal transduction histidine kinase